MTDRLADLGAGVDIWCLSAKHGWTLQQNYREQTDPCGLGRPSVFDIISYGGGGNSSGGADLVVQDPDTGIGYFHLHGITVNWYKAQVSANCIPQYAPGTGAPVASYTSYMPDGVSVHDYAVTDGSSDVNPYTGLAIMPHAGYPIVAAIPAGTDFTGDSVWYAIAGGDTTVLDLAHCKAAVPSQVQNVLVAPDEIDILIQDAP